MAENTPWEYRVQTVGGTLSVPKDDDLAGLLNEWGEEGWEVISFHPIANTGKIRLVAKRFLNDRARRRRSMPDYSG